MRWLVLALVLHGVAVPRGSRPVSGDADRALSSKSYRDTVAWIDRRLEHDGIAHHKVGPYRARGVDVTRWISDQPSTEWLAIHVEGRAGKTWIAVVARPTS